MEMIMTTTTNKKSGSSSGLLLPFAIGDIVYWVFRTDKQASNGEVVGIEINDNRNIIYRIKSHKRTDIIKLDSLGLFSTLEEANLNFLDIQIHKIQEDIIKRSRKMKKLKEERNQLREQILIIELAKLPPENDRS